MKKIYPIVWLLTCLTLICSCTDEDLVKNADGIYLCMPDIQISDPTTEVISRADGDVKYVDFNTVESVKLYLTLNETNDKRSTVFEYKDGQWGAGSPLMVSGGARTYQAKLAAEVKTISGTTFYACYVGGIEVKADGKFSAILNIYTTRVKVVLKDKDDEEVSGYTIEYTGFQTTGLSLTGNVVNWEDDNSRPKYADGQTLSGVSPTAIIDHIKPTTISKDTKLFTIKKDGIEIATVIYSGEEITLEGGKSYIFNITLGDKVIYITEIKMPAWGDEVKMPLDIKTKGGQELTYQNGIVKVSGPYGLMYLQMWINSKKEDELNTTDGEVIVSGERSAINIELTKTINMNELPDESVTMDGTSYSKKNWKPITTYTGTFNGNGYSIQNLPIEAGSTGLISTLGEGGVVKGVILDSSVGGTLVGTNNGTVLASAAKSATSALVNTNSGKIVSCYTDNSALSGSGSGNIKYSYHSATDAGATLNGGSVVSWTGTEENKTVYPITVDMNRGIAEYNDFELVADYADYAKIWDDGSIPGQTGGPAKWYMENYKEHYKTPLEDDVNFKVFEDATAVHSGYEAWNETGLNLWAMDIIDGNDGDEHDDLGLDLYVADNINLTKEWNYEIGQYDQHFQVDPNNDFTGKIYGNNHKIIGLKIENGSDAPSTGFIASMGAGSLVENLTFTKVEVKGAGKTGTVAGFCMGGEIINCHVTKGSVIGDEYVGGVVGWIAGESNFGASDIGGASFNTVKKSCGLIADCENTGLSVSGRFRVGGVVGECIGNSVVEHCMNSGSVSMVANATEPIRHFGGVVGTAHGIVVGCWNTGTVIGDEYVGGVAGSQGTRFNKSFCSIVGCYNTGKVNGANNVGGIVGANHDTPTGEEDDLKSGYLVACYSTGGVTITETNGGSIVGYLNRSDILKGACMQSCYSLNSIGKEYIGGQEGTMLQINSSENVDLLSQTQYDDMNNAIADYNFSHNIIDPEIFGDLYVPYKCNYYFDASGEVYFCVDTSQ